MIAPDRIERVEPFEDISEAYEAEAGSILLTTIYILGTPMHLGAIRLADNDGEQTAADPVLDPELDKVFGLYDTALETTDVPGFEGRFVLYATPHGA